MKKIITAALAVACLPIGAVSANVEDYSAKLDGNVLTVSGTVESGAENIALEIIKDGYTFDQITAANIADVSVYQSQQELGTATEFSFKLPLDDVSAKYGAKLNGVGFTAAEEFTVSYINPTEFATKLAELKDNLADQNTFETFMQTGNNAFLLGADGIPTELSTANDVLYASVKKNISEIKSSSDMESVVGGSVVAASFNENKVTDIADLAKYVEKMGDDVKKWYKHVIDQKGGSEKLTMLLKGATYADNTELETAMKKALVLTTVRYPNGVKNIGLCMYDFKDLTGVTKSNETAKYTEIAGSDYSDFDDFISAFKTIKVKTTSSGGGSSSGNKSTLPIVVPQQDNNTDTIDMKFIDLDTVPWAYEAISALSDKGIIAGRSEDRFAPDETVKREEFVKMLVCLLGLDNESYTNAFSDVDDGAWYAKYVNIGYNHKINSGVGDGDFGVGMNITRQDMAVMLYNAMKANGFEGTAGEIAFADADQIKDYAKEAISVLVNAGVINGVGDNLFDPNGIATRAQAARMIFAAMKIM